MSTRLWTSRATSGEWISSSSAPCGSELVAAAAAGAAVSGLGWAVVGAVASRTRVTTTVGGRGVPVGRRKDPVHLWRNLQHPAAVGRTMARRRASHGQQQKKDVAIVTLTAKRVQHAAALQIFRTAQQRPVAKGELIAAQQFLCVALQARHAMCRTLPRTQVPKPGQRQKPMKTPVLMSPRVRRTKKSGVHGLQEAAAWCERQNVWCALCL